MGWRKWLENDFGGCRRRIKGTRFGKQKTSRLALSSAGGSRPGSSAGPVCKFSGSRPNGKSPDLASRSQSPTFGSSHVQFPATPSHEDEDADLTITLPKAAALSTPGSNPNLDCDGLLSSNSAKSMETFEAGVVSSGLTFPTCLSAKIENRSSNGISVGQHLMMKDPVSKVPPKTMVVGSDVGKTRVSFPRMLSPEGEKDEGQQRLVNITVWNDAPVTPETGDSNWSSMSVGQQRYVEASSASH